MDDTADQSLRDRVSEITWYHRMDLHGVVTPGVSDTRRGLPRLHLPERLDGKRVLDIGAWDGFYSFEAARRGATRVLATDSYAWSGVSWGSKDGFLLARSALGLDDVVDDMYVDVLDLSEDLLGGRFDVTLLLGVLYHLRDPITAIERAASVTDETLIIETESTLNWLPFPAARVYPGRELNNDPTNYYSYNRRALAGLLREQGFPRMEVKYRTSAPRRLARAVRSARTTGFLPAIRSSRIVIHAHRR